MFKKNLNHSGTRLFDFTDNLPEKLQSRLSKSWAKIFYEEVFCKIDESKFKDMYSDNASRPNFPINILISLEILRALFDLTDEHLLENYHCNLQYMLALGINKIGDHSLSTRTLYYFRERFQNFLSQEENQDVLKYLFDTLRDNFISKANIKTKIQRTDSTMIAANIRKLKRYELVLKVARNLLKIIPEETKNRLSPNIIEILERNETETIFDIFSDTDKNLVVFQGLKLLNQLKDELKNEKSLFETKEYQIVLRVLQEQTQASESNLEELIVKEGKDISPNSLQNPSDPDASYRKKAGKSYQGYTANIVETASKENPIQIITAVSVEKNTETDSNLLKEKLSDLQTTTGVEKIVADGAYHSKELLKEAKQQKIEIIRTNLNGSSPEGKKFSYDQYKIENDIVAECPVGEKPIKSKHKNNRYVAHFDKNKCNKCHFKNQCRIRKQKKANLLEFTDSQLETANYRKKMETDEYKELFRLRPAVEGTFSGLKRSHSLGVADTRTLPKVRYFVMFKIMATNFKRYDKYLNIQFILEYFSIIFRIKRQCTV